MRRDTARVVVVTVTAVGILAAGMTGMAGPSDGVRLPAPPGVDRPAPSPTSTVVGKGDHFWKISARHLKETGRHPRADEIGPYWRQVVDANRDTIRSGDPDLIYPGEVVLLPTP